MNGMNTTGLLIRDVSDDELALLREVRDHTFVPATGPVARRAIERGLVDEVAGGVPSLALATPGLHTLWAHDRPFPPGAHHPWEVCDACGATPEELTIVRSDQAGTPRRVDCRRCGSIWIGR